MNSMQNVYEITTGIFQVLATARARKMRFGNETTRIQGFSKMAAGSRLSTQPRQPVFVAGTRVGIQAIPESTRPRAVVPTSAGTQLPARQFFVTRPLDRQEFATNTPIPQPVST